MCLPVTGLGLDLTDFTMLKQTEITMGIDVQEGI